MPDDDSVVIIGAGLMGAASAWALARRGRPVTVLEQFPAGHRNGSSHGSARVVRRGYGDALYTRLTGRAFELWRELEATSGASLLRMLGVLDFGPNRHVPTMAHHLATHGVPHEMLPAPEAESRWPGMRFAGDVLFHAEGGTVDSERAVAALLAESERAGTVVRTEVGATAVRPAGSSGGGVQIECSDGSLLHASVAVVAAGAWAGPLLDGVVALPPLRVTQHQVFHFPRLDTSAPLWPSVIHEDARATYHLAGGRDGGPGDDRKVGEHDAGVETTAADRDHAVSPESRERLIKYVRQWLPGLEPTPRSEATCLYTETPSEDFLLDRVGDLVVCSPCSGHGAKFAPLVGEYVADLVTTGTAELPDRFRLAAHALGRMGSVSL